MPSSSQLTPELPAVEQAVFSVKTEIDPDILCVDVTAERTTDSVMLDLVAHTLAKLQDDPAAAPLVYSLHGGIHTGLCGEYKLAALQDRVLQDVLAAEPPAFDLFRLERICVTNWCVNARFRFTRIHLTSSYAAASGTGTIRPRRRTVPLSSSMRRS